MNFLTLDQPFEDLLRGILEPVELRDSSGKVLGLFAPLLTPGEKHAYEKARTLFDPAELERRLTDERGQGQALGEFLQQLRSSDVTG